MSARSFAALSSLALALMAIGPACSHPRATPTPTVSTSPSSSAAKSSPADAKADAVVAAMLRRVSKARHLPAKTKVTARVLDRQYLLAKAREGAEKDTPKESLIGQQDFLIALGLMPVGYDLFKGTLKLLEAQLAGFYDPDDRMMYLAADLDADAAEETLAHELVHALQDQYYDLGPLLKFRPDDGDRSSAVHSMAEGDAVSATMDVSLEAKGVESIEVIDEDEVAMHMREDSANFPGTEGVPSIIKSSLISSYADGLVFVQRTRRKYGWKGLEQAWKRPPATTEQLLHLDKYEANEPPIAVPKPSTSQLGRGYTIEFSDTLGEQGLKLILEEWGSRRAADSIAKGWGGDRETILTRPIDGGAEKLVIWETRYDASSCGQAERMYTHVLGHLMRKGAHRPPETEHFACFEQSGSAPFAVVQDGCTVVVKAGPFLATGTTMKATGTCEELKKSMRPAR